jgi:hypothetical protein
MASNTIKKNSLMREYEDSIKPRNDRFSLKEATSLGFGLNLGVESHLLFFTGLMAKGWRDFRAIPQSLIDPYPS